VRTRRLAEILIPAVRSGSETRRAARDAQDTRLLPLGRATAGQDTRLLPVDRATVGQDTRLLPLDRATAGQDTRVLPLDLATAGQDTRVVRVDLVAAQSTAADYLQWRVAAATIFPATVAGTIAKQLRFCLFYNSYWLCRR
jgi:hypothetical protein